MRNWIYGVAAASLVAGSEAELEGVRHESRTKAAAAKSSNETR